MFLCLVITLLVPVLDLGEVCLLPLDKHLLNLGRVLPNAVPAARSVTDAVSRVGVPFFALLGSLADLENAHLAIPSEHSRKRVK
jgi:hypothetical protein